MTAGRDLPLQRDRSGFVRQHGHRLHRHGNHIYFVRRPGRIPRAAAQPVDRRDGHVQRATLKTAGTATLTATDAANSLGGTSGPISVNAGALAHFLVVGAPTTVAAGGNVNFTVTAQDSFNNTVTGFTGTVHFTTTDAAATPPPDSTLASGTGQFSVTLKTVGPQTLTATAGAATGTSNPITVISNGVLAQFAITGAPSSTTAGTPFTIVVTAEDSGGNPVTSYTGTVHFKSTDTGTAVVLPLDYTFLPAENGVHTFTTGVTLVTAGAQTVGVADTTTTTATGSATITVNPAAAAEFYCVCSLECHRGWPDQRVGDGL